MNAPATATAEVLPKLVTEDPARSPWPDKPRLPGAPEPTSLPVDVLPPGLYSHVESVAAATQTPSALGAMLALSVVSAAVRGRYEVRIDERRWVEPVCIYTTTILPPASRKSAVYSSLTGVIEEFEAAERERIGPEHRRAMDKLDVATAKLAGEKTKAAKGKDADVEGAREELDKAEAAVPTIPRIVLSDATPEALVRTMAEQGGALALLGPEADPLGLAEGRYSEVPRLDEMLRAWSGEAITVDRIGRGTIHIPRATLTLGLAIQPMALESLRHGRVHRGRGLWGRILWCMPPHGLGSRLTGPDVPALNESAAEVYAEIIRTLLRETALETHPVNSENTHARPDLGNLQGLRSAIRTLALTDDARSLVWQYEREIEDQLGDKGALAGLRDWAGKVVGQAVRLAALLELARRAENGQPLDSPVGKWAMEGAIRLARALTTHAMAALEEEGAAVLRYVLRRACEIPSGSTLRDLHNATRDKPGLETMEVLQLYVNELDHRGCIRLVERPRSGPGRPPSPLVEIHPSILEKAPKTHPHNPQNTPEAAEPANTASIAGAFPGEQSETEVWEV